MTKPLVLKKSAKSTWSFLQFSEEAACLSESIIEDASDEASNVPTVIEGVPEEQVKPKGLKEDGDL